MKSLSAAVWIVMLLVVAGCHSADDGSSAHTRKYRRVPAQTGSYVGRYVAVGSATDEQKAKRKKKARERRKAEQPRDETPAPPADRFR